MYPTKLMSIQARPWLKMLVKVMPRMTDRLAGVVFILLGMLMLTGGSLYLQTSDRFELHRFALPYAPPAGIIVILLGIWIGFINLRLQLKINKWCSKGIRRLWS